MQEPENFVGNRQVIWIGKDNTLDFILKEDGVAQDLSGVTKVELEFDSSSVITDTTPGSYPIKWEFTPAVVGKISLQLGKESATPTELEKYHKATLTLFDGVNDDGITWGEIPLYMK